MKPRNNSLPVRLKMVRNAVEVKDNPSIRDYLEKYGYRDTRFKEGENLYNEAVHYDRLQQNSRLEQIAATDRFHKIFEKARRVCMDNVKVPRVALKDDREDEGTEDLFFPYSHLIFLII